MRKLKELLPKGLEPDEIEILVAAVRNGALSRKVLQTWKTKYDVLHASKKRLNR